MPQQCLVYIAINFQDDAQGEQGLVVAGIHIDGITGGLLQCIKQPREPLKRRIKPIRIADCHRSWRQFSGRNQSLGQITLESRARTISLDGLGKKVQRRLRVVQTGR